MKKRNDKVERVKALRAKNKSFREIARLLRADVRSVYRWYTYGKADVDSVTK